MDIFTQKVTKPSEVEQKISTEQMRMLYQNLPLNTLFHLTAGFILCVLLWTKSDHRLLLVWLAAVGMIALLKLGSYFYFRANKEKHITRYWNWVFGIGAFVTGIMWGLAGVILVPHEALRYELFVGFIIAGMAMGAVPVLSSVKEVYYSFALAADLPYIAHMLSHESDIYVAVAIIHCLFLLLMLVMANRMNKLIKESLLLRFYNVDLVDKLQGEVLSHRQTEEKLRENEQRLSALANASFEGIVLHHDGIIIEANRGICEMTDFPVDELTGSPVAAIISKSCHDDVMAYIKNPTNLPLEAEACRKDGSCFPIEIRAGFAPYRGELLAFVVLRDITHYKELLKTQAMARLKAEEADLSKTEFLAAVSHELRTPLNAVMGFTQLLHDTSLNDEQQQHLSVIYQSGEQLLHLINDLLDLSRIESGRFDLDIVSFDLRSELNHVLSLMSLKLADNNNMIRVAFADDLPELIEADRLRLRQILINVLGNAIKFTENGEIEFSVYIEGERLIFTIKDSGKGIPEDKLDFIFGKFNQVDSSVSRQHGGTGLGLAISKRLVEVMKGTISVSSKLGGGAVFRVDLPLIKNDISSEQLTIDKPAHELLLKSAETKSLNILLVEDDKTNQMIALAMLKKFGHNITVVENGQHAVDLCQDKNQFQLIFMDIQMPVMDGITATQQLRQQGVSIPIIAMTANAMTGDREFYLKAGMNDYISKPIFTDALRIILEHYSRS